MLQIILEPANRRLLEMEGVQCRTVFVGTAGKEISSSMWSPYFSRLLSKLGTARFTAQQLRSIFVAERRSTIAVEVGAALAMGNSPGMWDRVYDRSFRRREMQAAVDAMQLWREGAIGVVDVEALANVMPVVLEEEIEICLLSGSDSDIEIL
ncbi:TPA: hypothetical protein ACH3X3_011720 [Trebouxia sp. C0006]